jgi:LuxR family transcriptional regulator, quorum-sensing system regulator CviR
MNTRNEPENISNGSSLSSRLSGRDAIALLELIHRSVSCISKENLVDLFPMVQGVCPFDYACAMLGYRDEEGVIVTEKVNFSYPIEFLKQYTSRNYFQVDAVVKENFATYKLQCWDVNRKRPSQPEELIAFAANFNIKSGFAHGSKPFGRGKYGSLFSFANSSNKKMDRRTETVLEILIPHLHLALSKVCDKRQSDNPPVAISAREREVLNWLKQGKSSWDISSILGISQRTVNFHIYNIMQKLGTINRPQTIAIAARMGLIDLD